MLLLFTFMYIFNFIVIEKIPILKSGIIVGIVLIIKFLLDNKYRYEVIQILKLKVLVRVLCFLLFLIIYSVFIVIIKSTYDFSIVKTFFNQGIFIIIGIFLYALFKNKNKEHEILKYIIYVFFIQSIIQLISFISNDVNEILNVFRPENIVAIGTERYSGIRGLAVSSYGFFALGCGYAIVYILIFDKWDDLFNDNIYVKIFMLISMIFGGLSAARSSIIGIILGVVLFFIKKFLEGKLNYINKNKSYKLKNLCIFYFFTLIIFIIYIFLSNIDIGEELIYRFEKYKRFVFEMFYNIANEGSADISSLNKLFGEMYFEVESDTFFLGDGRYMNEIGTGYYMGTDAGYMRNILFFGVVGFAFLFIHQIICLNFNKKNRLLSIMILLCILILHIKGDILGFSIICQSMIILIYINSIYIRNIE